MADTIDQHGFRRMRAVYLLRRAVLSWDDAMLAGRLDDLAGAGFTAVITKLDVIGSKLVSMCRERGLAIVGSFACFSDHQSDVPVEESLRPVDDCGAKFAEMDGYRGVIPTDEQHCASLSRQCRELLQAVSVDGLVLDFVRWPVRWELELRPGATPRRSSFDPITLRKFAAWLRQHGASASGIVAYDPAQSAKLIGRDLPTEWRRFRCEVIEEFAVRLAALGREAGLWLGAFVIPFDHGTRVDIAGQDVVQLARSLDVLFPMTYHAIIHRPPSWPAKIAAEIRSMVEVPVVTMVQATSDRTVSGGRDWGPPVETEEFVTAMAMAMEPSDSGSRPQPVCVFPGEALVEERLATVHRLFAGQLRPSKSD